MKKNKRTKIILIIVLTVLAVFLLIYVILEYKQHKCNQEYIHPNKVTNWACKEINMKIIYDNNSEIKSAYNGELILNSEKTDLSIEIIGTGDTMNFYKTEDYYEADDGDKKLFSGEFNFKNEKEFKLKIIDNKFLPDNINNLTFDKTVN